MNDAQRGEFVALREHVLALQRQAELLHLTLAKQGHDLNSFRGVLLAILDTIDTLTAPEAKP